jgi:hypothetical protein
VGVKIILYIAQSIGLFIFIIYIIKRKKYSSHALITTYLFFVLAVDIPEIIFNQLLGFYKFPTHLFTDNLKDNQMGVVFSDGVILPMTYIILCQYAEKTKKLWSVAFVFTVIYGILEWIYLKTGYLIYYKWNILISIAFYLFISRFIFNYASRLMLYKPPLPYFIRIGTSTYAITAWFGAILGGSLMGLYQWRPFIFKQVSADDRFSELGISLLFAILSAACIPKIKHKLRPMIFISFAITAIIFSYYSHGQGWLIYHKWNDILTAIRWLVPFSILIWLDYWESNVAINNSESEQS